jgi:exopolysaccharide production protein ExoZ
MRGTLLFEVGGRNRLLPMEGMRGMAVTLVFLQHYCRQFVDTGQLTGSTAALALFFRHYGNFGVELFFVLSGFLIYGMLLRKDWPFVSFMLRRGQRIYPAFLAAFAIACLLDFSRPLSLIPHEFIPGAAYLSENLFFLPGLLPVPPISAVNWSLSYEWWFYASATLLFATLGVARLTASVRISVIIGLGLLLMSLSAMALPNIPIRGFSLLAGMLLAESRTARLPAAKPWIALLAVALSAAVALTPAAPPWLVSLCLANSFTLLCSAAFFAENGLSRFLSLAPLRWLGNISYSFYLLHGMVVVVVLHFILLHTFSNTATLVFWSALPAVFLVAFAVSSCLFLSVEKPLSQSAAGRVAVLPDQHATIEMAMEHNIRSESCP